MSNLKPLTTISSSSPPTNYDKPQSRIIHNILSGTLSSTLQLLFLFPIDTIKTRLQTQSLLLKSNELPLFNGAIDCAKKTFKKEGFKGFYKGMTSILVMIPFSSSILFVSYGKGKELCEHYNLYKNKPIHLTSSQYFIAGALSGFVSGLVCCPQELVKVKLQMQVNETTYSGPIDCIKSIIRKSGLRGLYTGLTATMARDISGTAVWYGSYEIFRRKLGGHEAPVHCNMIAGALAGASYWIVAFPADLVKSRVQWSGGKMLPIFEDIIAKNGTRGLYTGFSTALARSMPSSAV